MFSGVPNKVDKIRIGYLTPAFLGAQKRAEWLHNPCFLGGPQQSGQNQKWLPHPCLLGGPKEGGIAMQPLRSRGSPNKGTKSEVKTYARGNNDAPSTPKYGSLVRPTLSALSVPPYFNPLYFIFTRHLVRFTQLHLISDSVLPNTPADSPQKIRSEQESSLDAPFSAHDVVVKTSVTHTHTSTRYPAHPKHNAMEASN